MKTCELRGVRPQRGLENANQAARYNHRYGNAAGGCGDG